jgi:hypothetical protein
MNRTIGVTMVTSKLLSKQCISFPKESVLLWVLIVFKSNNIWFRSILKNMVKLTAALVTRKTRKKSRLENDTDILRKLTHLHLQGNFIDTIVSTVQLCHYFLLNLQ